MSLSSKYEYEDTFQKIKYNFELSVKEHEIFFILREENIFNKDYETSFSLTTLIEKNNIFKICNTVEDCYNFIAKIINNKKYKISKEANDINIILYIKNIISENEEEIKLNLKAKNLETNIIFENYNNILNDLKNENIILKNDIYGLKTENNILKNEISGLKNEILELKKISQEYKSFKEQKYTIIDERIKYNQQNEKSKETEVFYDLRYSSILNETNEKIFFQSLIKCKNLKLLYRLSRDGSEPQDFHKFCDYQGATLILFKSKNNRKFGGYLSKNWESSGDWKKDNNVFLFSIDLKKKYKVKNNMQNTYYCYKEIGPSFLAFGFQNYGNLLFNGKCYEYDLRNYYELNQDYKSFEITGNTDILCQDLEVYKVE